MIKKKNYYKKNKKINKYKKIVKRKCKLKKLAI